eukprot:TRINITY_DN18761_c0_g1_i1.p1 TRINITY_DN18761_c0_g1~~TRINITY_DN18761_c0_g1_i1.p1  ORF type:complete len:584 (+),score=99.86 TRINITY_DN18761_c0_g1_i1:87-1754(+)
MAAAYNHRPYMEPEDLSSSALVCLASGINSLGYYMFHGGNNPDSMFGDAPEHGLQESSFQPAGAQNPMATKSYDFFAPIGEFGQLRRHYHQFRRLHLFLQDFGETIAPMVMTLPTILPTAQNDTSTLRWATRSDGESGFLFFNNYQRLKTLPPKKDVRFELTLKDGKKLTIPHETSDPFTVSSGIWAHWPFNLKLGSVTITWATAQVISRVSSPQGHSTLVLVETEGVPAEIALAGVHDITSGAKSCTHIENTQLLCRGLTPGKGAAVTAVSTAGDILNIILLPFDQADSIWKVTVADQPSLVISDTELVLQDGNKLQVDVRTATTTAATSTAATLSFLPAPTSLRDEAGMQVTGERDGLFTKFKVPIHSENSPVVKFQKIKEPGPARHIPKAPSEKAQEPTEKEWQQASVWQVEVDLSAAATAASASSNTSGPSASTSSLVRLAIDYRGDAVRVYVGKKLLTDNWFTGYRGDGQLEFVLDYLAGEAPALSSKKVNLTLHMLPLSKEDLTTGGVFVRKEYWPNFDGKEDICELDKIRVIQLSRTTLGLGSSSIYI